MSGAPNEPTTGNAAAPSKARRGPFGWFWRLGLVLALLVAGGLAVIVGTEPGLHAMVRLAQSAMPGRLSIESASGRLTGPVQIRGLRLGDPAAVVEVDRVALDWRPRELLAGRLHLSELELEGIRITPGEAQPAEPEPLAEPARLPDVVLPFAIVVDRIQVRDARLLKEGVPPLKEAVLRGAASGSELSIDELGLWLPGVRVALAGRIGLAASTTSDANIDWSWDAPQGRPLTGTGRVAGPIEDLQIEHRIGGAAEIALTGRVQGLPFAPRWDAAIDLVRVEPALLVAGVPALTLTGRLATHGVPADLSVEGRVRIAEAALGTHQVDLAVTLAADELRLERLDLTQPDGPGRIGATGRVRLAKDPELSVEAHWSALQWPPQGSAVATSPEGGLEVAGCPSAYRFVARGKAGAPHLPVTAFDLAGAGDASQARIEHLLLELLEGSVELGGEVGWRPEPRWDLHAALAGINPGVQWRDWHGRLSGKLASHGRIGADGPDAAVEIAPIEGTLRDHPLTLGAAGRVAGQTVQIERLALTSGSARIDAAGRAGDTLDLRWSIDARDLAQLLPGAAGSLKGSGTATGSREQPRVGARLDGSALRFQDSGIARLALDADLGIAPDAPLRLDLTASGIGAAGKAIGDLAAKASGSQRAHRFTLDLTGGETGIGGSLALSGGMAADRTWTGRLERTELRTGEWGNWRLQRPADLMVGTAAKVAPICLASSEARVCVEGSREAGGDWKGGVDLAALPLALVQPQLPKDVTIAGAVTGKVTATGTAGGSVAADATLALPGARLRVPMGEQARDLDLSKSTLKARIDEKGARAEARLLVGDLASADLKAGLPGWTAQSDPAKQRLDGAVKGRVPNVAFLKAFAPDLGALAGQVTLDLALDGTLARPRIKGQAGLTDGRVEVPDAGLDIRDVRLMIRSQGGDRLDFDGGARSGDGSLRLTGQTVLDPGQRWPTKLQLTGRDFTAFDTSEYVALISPDLRLTTGKDGAALEGELLIPRATIHPASLPKGTVAPSADVRIKGREPPRQGGGAPFAIRVRLRLGDHVRFDGYQLRARFDGNLLVEQRPGKDLIGNGRLRIAEGVYSGLGKDLPIQRGEINFASSPLDNPGINFRAVTETAEVTAGMIMTGTAREPKIELFSKPARPQSEILSYLLFGKPLAGTGREDKTKITDAAGALGSQLLASQIGRQLGLDELSVTGTGAKAALTVGQYVTPQLYLQYLSGLRSQINRLRVRYEPTKWLQIQTETGDAQGADLFYTFER